MSEEAPQPQPAMQTRRTVHGLMFTLGSYATTRALNLLVTILLARALGPEAMGLIAAALLVVEAIDMLRGLGLKETLIYDRSGNPALQSTAMTIMMAVAVVQSAALYLVAPLATRFVENPDIVPVLHWFALLFPITALGTVQEAILQRNFRFAVTSVAEVLSIVLKAIVAITMIWLGFGVWSLVFSMLVSAAARTAMFWILSGWRPVRPKTDLATAAALIGYGKHIFLSSLMNFLKMRADQLAIVTSMGDAALGIYFVAARIPDIVILGVNSTMTKVVFPTFSSLAHDRERLGEMYLATIGGTMLIMAPVSIGLVAIAPLAVPFLFGPDWAEAIPILMALALAGIPQTLGWTAGDVFKATGRPHLLTVLMVAQIAVTGPLVFAAAWATGDLVWIAGSIALGEAIVAGIRLWCIQHYEGVSAWRTLAAALRPVAAALVMGIAVAAALRAFSGLAAGLQLALAIPFGIVVFLLAALLIDGENMRRWLAPLLRRR